MKIKNLILIALAFFFTVPMTFAQDTTLIQTLTFDSTSRNYVFEFPVDTGQSYERIIMQYRMRCKDGLISTTSDRNKGCGEWDYSCNTYITDSVYNDSIKAEHPTHVISGFTGNPFYYTTIPTYSYTQYTQKQVSNDSIISEVTGTVGSGSDMLNHPFSTSKQYSKVQYLWTAAELTSASLTGGDITSIELDVNTASNTSEYLRIKMKHTAQTALDNSNPGTSGFTEVYFLNTTLTPGLNELIFYAPFNWDGSSNIIVELSYTNSSAGTDNIINGHDAGFTAGLLSSDTDYSLEFNGAGYVDLGASGLSGISDEITISLWCYGNPDVLPVNTNIFEGVDANNNRQVNSHLPWSNSRVYWDCGYSSGYDRIDKATTQPSEFEGQWNHWAFTKNAVSGSMKLYLNGVLWHSGTGKNKTIDLTALKLGASKVNTNKYYGNIDEFRIWDTELSATEISDWMHKDIDATHPNYANLVAYYQMNSGAGNSIIDASPSAETGLINDVVNWTNQRGRDIFKGFTETNMRPNVTFVQGVYQQTITDIVLVDSVQNAPSLVNSYHVVSNTLEDLATNFYYPSGNQYIIDDATGSVVDTIVVAPQDTITIGTLNYHHKTPMKFEIMSFVTPYGIGIDFGLGGVMWSFDVTDFKPILHGSKRLDMTRGGQFQEEMDISFLFIEGTPPRDVIDIKQIWRVDSRSYTQIANNDYFEPKTIILDSTANMFKIRSAITGHGQQGEFIPRTHYLNIDGGAPEFGWLGWKECADNEIYPQGGTWIYDRAGWCPGKATDLVESALTGYSPGQTIDLDYSMTTATGTSNYIVNHQLVSYGGPNFSLDARIVDVIKPSNKTEFLRDNPICQPPVVVIQNTGSTTLTSLTLTYNVVGGTSETYTWQGNLEFLETEEIVVTIPSLAFWNTTSSVDEFEITISAPNGGTDAYANNNYLKVPFTKPAIHDKPIILQYRTNNAPFENSYTIKDFTGNIIALGNGFVANTLYRDTLYLVNGCYELEWNDSGQDGIAWWANNDGTGYVWFRELGGATKVFEPDYGDNIRYSFVMDANVGIDENEEALSFTISPNPNNGQFKLSFILPGSKAGILNVYDIAGRKVYTEDLQPFSTEISLDLSHIESGVYNCIITVDELSKSQKVIITNN